MNGSGSSAVRRADASHSGARVFERGWLGESRGMVGLTGEASEKVGGEV